MEGNQGTNGRTLVKDLTERIKKAVKGLRDQSNIIFNMGNLYDSCGLSVPLDYLRGGRGSYAKKILSIILEVLLML